MTNLDDEFTFDDDELDFSALDEDEVAAYHRRIALASRGQKSQAKARSVVISNIELHPPEDEEEEGTSQPFEEFGSEEARRFRGKSLQNPSASAASKGSQNSGRVKEGALKRKRAESPDAHNLEGKGLLSIICFAHERSSGYQRYVARFVRFRQERGGQGRVGNDEASTEN